MKISISDLKYKGRDFERVEFETDKECMTEKEIIKDIKKFLDDVIEKKEKQ